MSKRAEIVKIKMTPQEAEQTLRALNRMCVVGEEPYFKPPVIIDAMHKVADAMQGAGVDLEESAKT